MKTRVTRSIVVALLAIALVEGILHVTGHRLGRTQEWYVAGVEYLIDSMDVIGESGVATDLAFAGTSLVMLGLRTDIAEAGLESIATARNVGLPDGYTPIQRRWLLEEVIPRLHPQRVVWGIASFDFNGNRPVSFIDLYEGSRAGKVGLTGPLDRALSKVSAISRYREFLRGPLFFKNLMRSVPPEPDPRDVDPALLMRSVSPWPILEQTPDRFAALRSSLVRDFYVGEREAEDFVFTIEAMRGMGIEVVIALLPVPSEYIAANDEGLQDFGTWQRWVSSTAADLGVPAFDYSRAIPDSHFADYNHVDEVGADMLTAMLVEDLKALGW